MNAQQAWQATVGQLQMEMPKASFDTWVRNAELVKQDNGRYVIGVQNNYARDWLESRLASTVSRLLSGFSNGPAQVEFVVWHKDVEQEFPGLRDEPGPIEVIDVQTNRTLITRYHFDNFVVGPSNRMAHAACLAVAWRKPGQSLQPHVSTYGGVGLGKTHLQHAIGNAALRRGLQVLYVSSEEFTKELINAIRTQHTQAFRERYSQHRCAADRRYSVICRQGIHSGGFFHTSTPCTTRKNRS